jgi:hypothetical protein
MHFCVNDGNIIPLLRSPFHVIAVRWRNFLFVPCLIHFSESFYFHEYEMAQLVKNAVIGAISKSEREKNDKVEPLPY